ncbi:hypothetical protein J2R77_008891 [Bradyrhizobium sp. USDA 4537]|nr:hypothetical protein [Bradyrhizobium sp. USDA 4537]
MEYIPIIGNLELARRLSSLVALCAPQNRQSFHITVCFAWLLPASLRSFSGRALELSKFRRHRRIASGQLLDRHVLRLVVRKAEIAVCTDQCRWCSEITGSGKHYLETNDAIWLAHGGAASCRLVLTIAETRQDRPSRARKAQNPAVRRAAHNRRQAARARHDMRSWQVERRGRSRHLIRRFLFSNILTVIPITGVQNILCAPHGYPYAVWGLSGALFVLCRSRPCNPLDLSGRRRARWLHDRCERPRE